MTPYLQAFQEYEKLDRGESWTDALDFHFQRGAVISLPGVFVMARRVQLGWEDDLHTMLGPVAGVSSSCWHVWAAAGNLRELLTLAGTYGVRWISYQRHGESRVRKVSVVQLFKRIR